MSSIFTLFLPNTLQLQFPLCCPTLYEFHGLLFLNIIIVAYICTCQCNLLSPFIVSHMYMGLNPTI